MSFLTMCECGCGEQYTPQLTFAGPDGITYGFAIISGCKDCDTPAGVMLFRIPDLDKVDHVFPDLKELPEIPWNNFFGNWDEFLIPLVEPKLLIHTIVKSTPIADDGFDYLDNDEVESSIHDHISNVSRKSIAEWLKHKEMTNE